MHITLPVFTLSYPRANATNVLLHSLHCMNSNWTKIASIYAAAPAATRGQGVHLDADPKGENLVYTNGKLVFIRNIAVSDSRLEKEETEAPQPV